jgi:hypothetical protein
MKHYILKAFALLSILFLTEVKAQNGDLTISKNKKIDALLELKKEANLDETSSKKYKIQIFSGSLIEARKSNSNYKLKYLKWKSTLEFETPNYKIWVGNFRTKLEADRALTEIKKSFEHAFIFKPKKQKKD